MAPLLSNDVYHLICIQLWHDQDFATLFNCILASKQLAVPAAHELYRMHNMAPVTGGGPDEVELIRATKAPEADLGNLRHKRVQVIKMWSRLWKSIIRSSMGKTMIPYCRYIQALDLRDLGNLFADLDFRGSIERDFFARDMADLKVEKYVTGKRAGIKILDSASTVNRVGELVTQHTPILEKLSGEIQPGSLSRWASRLPRLKALELWEGKALSDGLEDVIRTFCRSFEAVSIFIWSNQPTGSVQTIYLAKGQSPEPDSQSNGAEQALSKFLGGLSNLREFEIIRSADIGPAVMSALDHFGQSLTVLRLAGLPDEAMASLGLLSSCCALNTISLECNLRRAVTDSHDQLRWLHKCKGLEVVFFAHFADSTLTVRDLCLDHELRLREIFLDVPEIATPSEFFASLPHQQSLTTLELTCPSLDQNQDEMASCVSKLTNLKTLRLKEVFDSFTEAQIAVIAKGLKNLEDLYIGGERVTDAIWQHLTHLNSLKSLIFSADTVFTTSGILNFLLQLKASNKGFSLSIMNQDEDWTITSDERSKIDSYIRDALDGRFELVYFRDPESSTEEFSD